MSRVAIVHLDESCLGNGREGENPGGTGGLIEVRAGRRIQRRDFYCFDPDTTNNRMALHGAALALRLLAAKGNRLRVLMVSDSEYLVKGMREWAPGWAARGWSRKTGPIENLALWQSLAEVARLHEVQWTWVRGHRGHPKNEYANDLAVARPSAPKAGIRITIRMWPSKPSNTGCRKERVSPWRKRSKLPQFSALLSPHLVADACRSTASTKPAVQAVGWASSVT